MSLLALVVLAFSMSMDAFSVAIAKGATLRSVSMTQAMKQGLVFGVVEAIAPIIGWALGQAAHQWIRAVDHWLGFVLLTLLGIRCIYNALTNDRQQEVDKNLDISMDNKKTANRNSMWLFITAIATSIDATVVGVTLAFLQVNIWLAAALIGLATTIMATMGLYLGRQLGDRFGKGAMIAGGVLLIIIGCSILYRDLMA